MRIDCNARDSDDCPDHRCCLAPGHEGRHLCADCRHSWPNLGYVLTDQVIV